MTEQNPNLTPPTTLAAALLSRAGRRVLLVGEAPARGSVAALDLASRTGREVVGMMPATPFDAVNLLGRGDSRWSPEIARYRARQLLEEAFAGREVCLLGRRVARAFARMHPALDALAAAPPFSQAAPTVPDPAGGWARSMVWWAPHPSGRNRWWNVEANRRAGEAFFRYVLGRLEFPARPEVPAPATGMLEAVLDDLTRTG
jgi:hypothetical protein